MTVEPHATSPTFAFLKMTVALCFAPAAGVGTRPAQLQHACRRPASRPRGFVPMMSTGQRSVLVVGGGSVLGVETADQFSADGWRVVTLDHFDSSMECGGTDGCALPEYGPTQLSLAMPAGAPARTQARVAANCLRSACSGPFDVVLNATLGFSVAGLQDDDLFDSAEYMHSTSVNSSLVTARLAAEFLKPGGLLALVGSVAALPTTRAPRLLGFGMAKAAVHQ